MSTGHPFNFVSPAARQGAFVIFLILALICLALFAFVLDPPLRTAAAPWGIVSFELAWRTTTVSAILGSWDHAAKVYAAFSLGFDFLFILCYAFVLGIGTQIASDRLGRRFGTMGRTLGWGVILAVLLDVAENILLFVIMTKGNFPPYALFASLAATLKFLLILIVVCYVLLGLLAPRASEET